MPERESLYAGSGEPLSLRLRVYIGFCGWFLTLAPVVVVVWMGFQLAGRALPAATRRRALMVGAALAGPVTIAGLYFMAEDSLPNAPEMKILSDRVRAVSQERLDQLSR